MLQEDHRIVFNRFQVSQKVWNKLPPDFKLEGNPNKFKHKIKDKFFENLQRANDDIYVYY